MADVERVFARIATCPRPRPGDRVTLSGGEVGVVDTAQLAGDGRDAKCTVLIDRSESPNRLCYLCGGCGTIAPVEAFPALICDWQTEHWRPAKHGDADPMVICPACEERHQDDDCGPGLYQGSRVEMERQRARLLDEYHQTHGADVAHVWDETFAARCDVLTAALEDLRRARIEPAASTTDEPRTSS
jgi:hypothetical protein